MTDSYLDKYSKLSLAELHKKAMESIDKFDNYNYDNEDYHWEPVAKDEEFTKHINKLKAMKKFNEKSR